MFPFLIFHNWFFITNWQIICQYYEWCDLGVAEASPHHPTSHFLFRLSSSNIYYYSNMELEKLLVTYKL